MPLFKEWTLADDSRVAIWKIEEPESFFAAHTQLSPEINNEKRRIEHMAGRFLLQYLEQDFPIHSIAKDEHDKPRIENNEYYFSISHSWPYVAVVISEHTEAGIDIQTWHPRIESIKHKFLSVEEQEMFKDDPKLLTMAWCAKEAAYKWNGRRGIEFIDNLSVAFFSGKPEKSQIAIYYNLSKMPQMIFTENIISIDFACSYVIRSQDWAIY